MDNVARHMRRKKTRAAAAATAVAALPDDIVLEVLVRVDDGPTLFRCAVTCKPWRSLVADLSFLHRRWPNGARHRSSVLGVVARHWRSCATPIPRQPALIPTLGSPLGPSRCLLGSFFPSVGGLLDEAVPIIMRSGLILVRLSSIRTRIRLAVCNLLTGTCDVLPPLNYDVLVSGMTKYVILTDTDYCSKEGVASLPSYSTFFEVMIIFFEYSAEYYSVRTFSSANSSWSAPRRRLHHMGCANICGNAVVCQGKIYCLVQKMGKFHTIELCITTGHLSTTEFLIPLDQLQDSSFNTAARLSLTIDGKLSLVRLHIEWRQLQIWTRQGKKDNSDDDDAVRPHTKVIELKHKLPQTIGTFYMHVGVTSGTLLVTDQHKFMCIVNLETGTTDEDASMFDNLKLHNMVPIEMDWPAFFMSRLTRANVS